MRTGLKHVDRPIENLEIQLDIKFRKTELIEKKEKLSAGKKFCGNGEADRKQKIRIVVFFLNGKSDSV